MRSICSVYAYAWSTIMCVGDFFRISVGNGIVHFQAVGRPDDTMGLAKALGPVRRLITRVLDLAGDGVFYDQDGLATLCNCALFGVGYNASSADVVVDGDLVKAAFAGNGRSFELPCSIVASGDIDDEDVAVLAVRCSYQENDPRIDIQTKTF